MAFARAKALKRFFRETWYMLPVSLILALIIEFLNHHTPEKLILPSLELPIDSPDSVGAGRTSGGSPV